MKNKKQGQILLEVVFALGAVMLVLIGLTVAANTSLKGIRVGKETSLAADYGQQTIEVLRTLRDREGFDSLLTGSCYGEIVVTSPTDITLSDPISCSSWSDSSIGGDSIFYRRINITEPVAGRKQAVVTIGWTDSDCSGGTNCHTVETTNFFTKWSK